MAKKVIKKTKLATKVPAKVEVQSDNPYKKGSRKADIYEVFRKEGLEAAMLYAESVDIKKGTVKSWSGAWAKGEVKPKAKAPADKPAKKERVVDTGFHPEFKYTSRERADAKHEALCTHSGLRPHAFHVIEDDGRFAVVPAHYKPGGPAPTFKVGDIVYDALIKNSKAKVLEAGPEQTLIRYVKERPKGPREECVINRFLVKLPEREPKDGDKKSTKIKRARL